MFILKHWYSLEKTWLSLLLLPLSYAFQWVVSKRRRQQIKHQYKSQHPVIVVGNITLGGTGKTPVVEVICRHLHKKGYMPAIISRGVGAKCHHYPLLLNENTSPLTCGDEPYMLYQQLGGHIPVIIDPKRTRAIKYIESNLSKVNIIISDDGLQHYHMARDIEIIVVDGNRGFGNGLCLPAGPLREPITRLNQVDMIIVNGRSNQTFKRPNYCINLTPKCLVNLRTQQEQPIDYLLACNFHHIHGVAGIGNPNRFFSALSEIGYQVTTHPFKDHHNYQLSDFNFNHANMPIIMTYKDAVKCQNFSQENWWYLKVSADMEHGFFDFLTQKLNNTPSTL